MTKTYRKIILAAGSALLAAGIATGALAAMSDHENRSLTMKAMGGHMGALGKVAKGEMAADAGTVVHAQNIVTISRVVHLLFPEGSGGGKSRAKPEIWSDWAGFQKAADNFAAATPALLEAAKMGNAGAIGKALGEVGKACGGCHKPYRVPKK